MTEELKDAALAVPTPIEIGKIQIDAGKITCPNKSCAHVIWVHSGQEGGGMLLGDTLAGKGPRIRCGKCETMMKLEAQEQKVVGANRQQTRAVQSLIARGKLDPEDLH